MSTTCTIVEVVLPMGRALYITTVYMYLHCCCALDNSCMDIKLTDIGVCAIAERIVRWEPLRPHLGLTEADEETIKSNNRRYEEQKKELLYKWRQVMGDDATPRNFVAAARDAGDKELADEVEKLALLIQPVDHGMRREVMFAKMMMITVLVDITRTCNFPMIDLMHESVHVYCTYIGITL